jgi:signal transduction histidine kinase/ActR/RegA family two-component response regulator
MDKNIFSPAQRQAYEDLPLALSISYVQGDKLQPFLVSEGFCRLLGYSREVFWEQARLEPQFFVAPEDWPRLQENEAQLIRFAGSERCLTLRIYKASGSSIPVSCLMLSRATAAGVCLCYSFYNDNVALLETEKEKHLYAELRQTVETYDLLLNATKVSILKFVRHGEFALAWGNEAAVQTLGYTREQYEARFARQPQSYFQGCEGVLEQLKTALDKALQAKQKSFELFCRLPTARGNIWAGGTVILTDFETQACIPDTIYVVFRNVTEEVRAREKLTEAKLSADRANQSKSDFLSTMSHDLRTPLNGILGFTDLALQEKNLEQKQAYLEKIKISGQLLNDLVNDTLELSRIESGKLVLKPELVDGKNFWSSLVTAMVPAAEMKGVRLETDVSSYPGEMIKVDQLQLKKVMLNLISNAIKYTPAGGTVKVEVQALIGEEHGYTRRLIVEDNGIGMHPEFLPRMFEPFAQENRPEARNVAGTGLGLAIVKRVVDLMGGAIKVQSKLNLGTRFVVDLPLEHWTKTREEAEKLQEEAKRLSEVTLQTLKNRQILLCEDNQLNAEIAMLLLRDKKMQVDWAKDGAEGVAKFKDSLPGYYDLVLMDIRMPQLDGYQAAQAIRRLDRADAGTVPILAMSANAFTEDVEAALKSGMNAYVTKPVNPQQLFQTLTKYLR